LTSDLSFARSICGDAALYFDPYNIHDITKKIEKIISDKSLYQVYVEKGLKTLKTFPSAIQRAEMCIEICNRIIQQCVV
jgi:hypothetical protein